MKSLQWLLGEAVVIIPLLALHTLVLLAFAQFPLAFFKHLEIASHRRLVVYKIVAGVVGVALIALFYDNLWLWIYGGVLAAFLALLFWL